MVYMLIVFAAALLVPAVIARFSRGSSDSDGDGGDGRGGGGSRRPPSNKPGPPYGGLPLDHSQPARIRLRDGRRLGQRLPVPARRPVREPGRRPARTASMNRCTAGSHGPPRRPRILCGDGTRRCTSTDASDITRTFSEPSGDDSIRTAASVHRAPEAEAGPGELLRADDVIALERGVYRWSEIAV
jgi:hypothetical protein